MRFWPSLFSFVACLVLVVPGARAASGGTALPEWRSIGPAVSGGRLGAVAGTDRDAALYYVGAAGGGVWKTTNAGQSWEPVFDAQDVASIGAIAIDPQNTQTVWVGTGESNPRNDVTQGDGVYKTTDGGAHWTKVLPLRDSLVSGVIVDPRNSAHVLVAVLGDAFADNTDRGIYRTTDGGTTWSKVLYRGPSTGASDIAVDPKNPDVLFAGMWTFRRTGWSLQSGGSEGGLFRSTDAGATWTQLTGNGLPDAPTGRIGLAIAASNPQRIYALIQAKSGLLWRSDDGGAHWTMTSNDTLINERPFYFSKVFVDPTNLDHLWTESVHMTVSTDGGKHFETTGHGTHGDHHAMWIAADGKRIIEGNDGGVAFSHDGGTSWAWDNALPVSQLYHISYSREQLYRVCAPLQDNGIYCAPANPLSSRGVSAAHWLFLGGGDGTTAQFDPRDQQRVWMTTSGANWSGDVTVFNLRTNESRDVSPYLRDQNVVNPKDLGYRFNWETPVAFDPFDPTLTYAGSDVVFASRDRGAHWKPISGDLTLHLPAHELTGGGITLDGTGAETSDTILVIEPSRAARGELWVGTDDGLIQLTRDGGAHWKNVSPPGIAPYGRFASISASSRNPGEAYAIYDRHMIGDRTPYVFATHDFGAHWSSIAHGLPGDNQARSILLDPRNPRLLYLGLERGLMASWDGGASWESIASNLAAVSVRDIRVQPDTNDLLLATHGRGAYIFDDATPLQQLSQARAAATYLFPIRQATQWNTWSYFRVGTDGDAPSYGALISYYLAKPAAHAPTIDIVDRAGNVVARLTKHVGNLAGVNRVSWDLTGESAHEWTFAPKWNRGYDNTIAVQPGIYRVRLHVDGRSYEQAVNVVQDPRTHYSASEIALYRGRAQVLLDELSHLDDALNALSTIAHEAPLRADALRKANQTDLATRVATLGDEATRLIATMTSNPANDQDNDFLVDRLRERLQGQLDTYFGSFGPATSGQVAEDAVLARLSADRLAAFEVFSKRVAEADTEVEGAKLPSLRKFTGKPAPTGDGEGDDERR